jgi:hypothetical protein
VLLVGGPDEAVQLQVEELRHVPEVLADRVDELLRVDATTCGRELDLLPVLVRSGLEEDLPSRQAHVPGQHVGGDARVGVADVRLVVHVVDRGRDLVRALSVVERRGGRPVQRTERRTVRVPMFRRG